MRALIVDDSRAMRAILGKAVREFGFEVLEAGHGREALGKLRECGVPELMLIDWNMPEMNGMDLVKAVRADPTYDSCRLVMVTTETEAAHIVLALQAGANEFIMKPFSKQVLFDKLTILGLTS